MKWWLQYWSKSLSLAIARSLRIASAPCSGVQASAGAGDVPAGGGCFDQRDPRGRWCSRGVVDFVPHIAAQSRPPRSVRGRVAVLRRTGPRRPASWMTDAVSHTRLAFPAGARLPTSAITNATRKLADVGIPNAELWRPSPQLLRRSPPAQAKPAENRRQTAGRVPDHQQIRGFTPPLREPHPKQKASTRVGVLLPSFRTSSLAWPDGIDRGCCN